MVYRWLTNPPYMERNKHGPLLSVDSEPLGPESRAFPSHHIECSAPTKQGCFLESLQSYEEYRGTTYMQWPLWEEVKCKVKHRRGAWGQGGLWMCLLFIAPAWLRVCEFRNTPCKKGFQIGESCDRDILRKVPNSCLWSSWSLKDRLFQATFLSPGILAQ